MLVFFQDRILLQHFFPKNNSATFSQDCQKIPQRNRKNYMKKNSNNINIFADGANFKEIFEKTH